MSATGTVEAARANSGEGTERLELNTRAAAARGGAHLPLLPVLPLPELLERYVAAGIAAVVPPLLPASVQSREPAVGVAPTSTRRAGRRHRGGPPREGARFARSGATDARRAGQSQPVAAHDFCDTLHRTRSRRARVPDASRGLEWERRGWEKCANVALLDARTRRSAGLRSRAFCGLFPHSPSAKRDQMPVPLK